MPDPVPQENLEEADKVWEEFKLKLDKLDESLSYNDKLRQTEETAKTICNFVVAGGKINEKRKESLEGGKRLGSLGEYARLAEDEARKLSGKALTGGLKKEEWALLRGLYVLQGAAGVMGLGGMTPDGAKKKFIQVADDLEVLEDVGEGKTLLDESDVMVRAFERLKEEMKSEDVFKQAGKGVVEGLKRQGVAPVAAEARPEENRAGEVMRRVEKGDQPDASQIMGGEVRRAVGVLGKAFANLGRSDWTPQDGEVKQIVDAVKVASARLLPEQYDRVVAGFGIKLFREIGMAFIAVQERGGILTAEEKVRMGNYVKLFKNSFPMMDGMPAVKKFLLEIEKRL